MRASTSASDKSLGKARPILGVFYGLATDDRHVIFVQCKITKGSECRESERAIYVILILFGQIQ